jgi:transcriptional regulator with XRE-family HTH domain
MVDYSNNALGQVVRNLRETTGMTQEALGREAGYRTGAGVSISRLESGLLRPGPERLAGIARALGLTADDLEARARSKAAEDDATASDTARTQGGISGEASKVPGQKELNAQKVRIEREISHRTEVITELSQAYNKAHDQARDEFFMEFLVFAERLDGAPQPEPTQIQDEDETGTDAAGADLLDSYANGVVKALAVSTGSMAAGAAVGTAAAYGTFVLAASFGTASTGAAISGLSGIAATNAALAVLGGGTLAAGGAGVAGGTLLLGAIAAAPAVILFAGGLAWVVKRNRKQRQEFAVQLDEAEAQLAATKSGVEALQGILPKAAETLDYIATHAGHALNRWVSQVGSGSLTWDGLGPVDQRQYQDFIEIAAVQVMIATINFQGLLITSGSERDRLLEDTNERLTESMDAVKARV